MVSRRGWSSGFTVSLVRGDDLDRSLLTFVGAVGELDCDMIPDELLLAARHVHVGSFYLLPELAACLPDLFEAAHAAGLTTSVDTQGDSTGKWEGGLRRVPPRCRLLLPQRGRGAGGRARGRPHKRAHHARSLRHYAGGQAGQTRRNRVHGRRCGEGERPHCRDRRHRRRRRHFRRRLSLRSPQGLAAAPDPCIRRGLWLALDASSVGSRRNRRRTRRWPPRRHSSGEPRVRRRKWQAVAGEGGDASALLLEVVAANRRGEGAGIYSVCSAASTVLEASMVQARRDGTMVLIESTCNQVNQFGGYTGMMPRDFAAFARRVALETHLPTERIILGGDHLGPYPWHDEPSEEAMAKARTLVAVTAPATSRSTWTPAHAAPMIPLGDPTSAPPRCARRVCRAAEEAWSELPPGSPRPVYVIGTEVPAPGGERRARLDKRNLNGAGAPELTPFPEAFAPPESAQRWSGSSPSSSSPALNSVTGHGCSRRPCEARALSRAFAVGPVSCFEAHSTRRITRAPEDSVRSEDQGFAILKVGPWLTLPCARRSSPWRQSSLSCLLRDPACAHLSPARDPRGDDARVPHPLEGLLPR